MQIVITAVGPDNRGLADPIIHHVTGLGANIAEIQMYDHDEEALFAMLCRIELAAEKLPALKEAMARVARETGRPPVRGSARPAEPTGYASGPTYSSLTQGALNPPSLTQTMPSPRRTPMRLPSSASRRTSECSVAQVVVAVTVTTPSRT